MVIGFPRRNIFASTKCALPIVILVMPPKTVKLGSMALQQFREPVQFGATEDSLRILITHLLLTLLRDNDSQIPRKELRN